MSQLDRAFKFIFKQRKRIHSIYLIYVISLILHQTLFLIYNLYSLRNYTNADVYSSIWHRQKLLDIYYICCVSLRSSNHFLINPIMMMSNLHHSKQKKKDSI